MPAILLLLLPQFDAYGAAYGIDVHLKIQGNFSKQKDDLLFKHALQAGPTDLMQYTADSIFLRDSNGPVSCYTKDQKHDTREFYLSRAVEGDEISVSTRATPREVNDFTPCGPQVGIEKEGRGLSAGGNAFILDLVPIEDTEFDITVTWILEGAPKGTRAVCSLGEGLSSAVKQKASVLQTMFFVVCPDLQSYPPNTIGSPYGMYWIDDPPFKVDVLARRMSTLSSKTADFFQDEHNFRIFLRHNQYKCASGNGLFRGFAFAWTSFVPSHDENNATEFLVHEMTHNWALLETSGDDKIDVSHGWYNEGIAEYYSILLPYRFGITTEEEFVSRLNSHMSGYYTNPERKFPMKDMYDNFWKSPRIGRVPYQRGLMYWLQLDARLHQRGTSGGKSLDTLVLEMINLKRQSKPYTMETWLSMLSQGLTPQEVHSDYQNIQNATYPIILPRDFLDHIITKNSPFPRTQNPKTKWILTSIPQEEFSLGFSPSSITDSNPRIVRGLDPKSRAAIAGVREGDEATNRFNFFWKAEEWGEEFWMDVKRKDEEAGEEHLKELRWWPRSWEKVESYQFVREEEEVVEEVEGGRLDLGKL